MRTFGRLTEWLNIRPNEVRCVSVSLAGAFIVMAFNVLARSLREALYLSSFDVKTLPYITAGVAIMSLPTVGAFTTTLGRYSSRRVVQGLVLLMIAGLLVLLPFATSHGLATIGFYIWTAMGTLLLGSGFWVVTSEYFAVRGAKRLYGLIGAGGTAGAMIMGMSMGPLTGVVELIWLIPLLIGLLLLFLLVQSRLPRLECGDSGASEEGEGARASMAENLGLLVKTPHLRTIGLIVLIASMASTVVDFQFKDFARSNLSTGSDLAGFFGAFYGWTGGIALLIQLLIAGRLMGIAGISGSLAVLPVLLLLGSGGILLAPSLIMVTIVRGADNSIRKSLFRPILEFLYVPIPSELRRKTKTFIDTVVDSAGEGCGAAVVFLLVTLLNVPSRYLSLVVILLAALFIVFSRRMGKQYLDTIVDRLKTGAEETARVEDHSSLNLWDVSFSRIDMQSMMMDSRLLGFIAGHERADEPEREPALKARIEKPPLERLKSPNNHVVRGALEEIEIWDEEHVSALLRLLARDALLEQVSTKLADIGERALSQLASSLSDDGTDFVIRRRIPRVLDRIGGQRAVEVLLIALSANRFEVRYRAGIALVRSRRRGEQWSDVDRPSIVWKAIRTEVSRGRPVWELQKLLDGFDSSADDLVGERVGVRGELSLEHTFRLLSLVLDPEPMRAAFRGIIYEDANLKSFSLEYLEQVLPGDVKKRLWLLIGDMSERQKEKASRPIEEIVSELVRTHATLFAGDLERNALKRMLDEREERN